MWPRVVECMLGCWLLISPFVFRYEDQPIAWWINDHVIGMCVIIFGLMSFWRRTPRAHLLTLLAALWLVLYGRLGHQFPFPPAAQNYITVGLLLMMFAIIPSNSLRPPAAWFKDLTAAGLQGNPTPRKQA
jgi:peptidoglycan/LPS O-acetylase OafA/YrhL